MWIKPRSSVPKTVGVWEHLAVDKVGVNPPWARGSGSGAASELLLELAPGNPYKISKVLEPVD